MNFPEKIVGWLWPLHLVLLMISCEKEKPVEQVKFFEAVPSKYAIVPGQIDEVSGISYSVNNPGFLWTQEDSDNPTELTLLSYEGAIQKKIPIENIINRDWEDLATGPGPQTGKSYLYLADIGDNNRQYDQYFIYRFEEPLSSASSVKQFDKITYTYPDGKHDAEAILIDQGTKDIYIITKMDAKSKLFKLPYPQSTNGIMTAEEVTTLRYNFVTSAAFAPDGKSLIVKTYDRVFYYERLANESLVQVFNNDGITLDYVLEQQGEAVSFHKDNTGFFTLSEKRLSDPVSLNYYKRK